MKTEPIWNR